MSTRSYIALKEGNGYRGIYCHFDGYPEGVGAILTNHYTNLNKIQNLISQGHASYLEKSIEESRFYHTWINEPLQIDGYNSAKELESTAAHMGCEWLYLFQDNQWKTIKLQD